MKKYELLYIVANTYTEEQQAKIAQEVEALIKKEGGQIVTSENQGKKKLAYPINKMKYGFYHLIEFDYETLKIRSLNRQLKLKPEILRFLILIKKLVKKAPPRKEPEVKKAIEAPVFKKEPEKEKPKEKAPKVSLEELDKKLDEILGDDIVKE